MLVAIQSHNRTLQVGVPHEDIEVEATRHEHFMFFAVCHLSYSTNMSEESLDGPDSEL